MTTEEKIESLRDEFNKKLDDLLKEDKPGFEVGKWYGWEDALMIYSKDENHCAGFYRGVWDTDWAFNDSCGNKPARPATPDEVKAALVKEAEKRGFKEGVKVRFEKPNADGATEVTLWNNAFFYREGEDELYSSRARIYRQGKWAEIIKESPLMVGSYEVKFNADHIMVGRQKVSNDLLKKIYEKQIIQP